MLPPGNYHVTLKYQPNLKMINRELVICIPIINQISILIFVDHLGNDIVIFRLLYLSFEH